MYAYREPLTPALQLLLYAVKGARSAEECSTMIRLYSEVGDDVIWGLAVANKVEPIVAHALMQTVGEGSLMERWGAAHRGAFAKTTKFVEELDAVSLLLADRGVSIAAIESGGVVCAGLQCPGCFASGDMEVLAAKQDLPEIDACLKGEGYERCAREGRASDDVTRVDHEQRGWSVYSKELDGKQQFFLNVMWLPVLRRWLAPSGEPPVGELIARSVPVTGRVTRIRILSPEDNVLHAALHTASHSYVRGPGLRLQLDIDRLVHGHSLDWKLFVRRAKKYRVRTCAFPALAIPRGLLGTPIPNWVLNALVSSERRQGAILRRIGAASVFHKEGKRYGRLGMLLLEARLCDDGPVVGLTRALFPPTAWMRKSYGSSGVLLPYYYGARLFGLLCRASE